ncbi:arsinothricin resistance N-acetyltransferase ArsN1 family A [Cohnella kolymensis]|uniref:arsinothricin resistance N-acetyltransferase ArsN1 family A n=1 Tax=Cohnella kolymensis TaxID=1590652 RepID=UPI000B2BEB5F|nr:arsinothricin resistance N-acetyltransferase ArsN1 family A [Cohnella kolymensis]
MNVRRATEADIKAIQEIYNQGIEDRIATLEQDRKTEEYMSNWFNSRQERYAVIAAEEGGEIKGWASINPYSARRAYDGVGDVSVYIHRDFRGRGIGHKLLRYLEDTAKQYNFYKLVLFTFPFNSLGQGLYRKAGYREVGTFVNQGILDGNYVDVMIMEKLLP